ncbi:MAG: hypothetical protein ACQESF_02175 [Nanobdellota archaeon]
MLRAIFITAMVLFSLPFGGAYDCIFDNDKYLEKACKVFIDELPEDYNINCDYECSWNGDKKDGSVNFHYTSDEEYLQEWVKERSASEMYEEEEFGDVLWSEFCEEAFINEGVVIVPEENSFKFYIESPNEKYPDEYLGVSIYTGGYDYNEARGKALEVLKALNGGKIVDISKETGETSENIDEDSGKHTDTKGDIAKDKTRENEKGVNDLGLFNSSNNTKKVENLTFNDIYKIQEYSIGSIDGEVVRGHTKMSGLVDNLTKINVSRGFLEEERLYEGQELAAKNAKKASGEMLEKLKASHNLASFFSSAYKKSNFGGKLNLVLEVKENIDEAKQSKQDINELSSIKGSSGNLAKGLYAMSKLAKKGGEKIPIVGKALETYGEVTEKMVTAIPKTQKKILEGSWGGEVRHGQGHGSYTPNVFMTRFGKGNVLSYTDEKGKTKEESKIDYWKKLDSDGKTYWVPHDEYGNKVGDVAIKEIDAGWKIWRSDNVKLVKYSNPSVEYNGGEEFDL